MTQQIMALFVFGEKLIQGKQKQTKAKTPDSMAISSMFSVTS